MSSTNAVSREGASEQYGGLSGLQGSVVVFALALLGPLLCTKLGIIRDIAFSNMFFVACSVAGLNFFSNCVVQEISRRLGCDDSRLVESALKDDSRLVESALKDDSRLVKSALKVVLVKVAASVLFLTLLIIPPLGHLFGLTVSYLELVLCLAPGTLCAILLMTVLIGVSIYQQASLLLSAPEGV